MWLANEPVTQLIFRNLAMSGKKVSGTICTKHPKGQFLANGTGHFFTARPLA